MDSPLIQLHDGSEALVGMQSGTTSSSLTRVQSLGSSISHSFASAPASSLSRSTTPDPQLIRRSPSPCLLPVGVRNSDTYRPNGLGGVSSHMADCGDVVAALSDLDLSRRITLDGEGHVLGQLNEEFPSQSGLLYDIPGDNRQFLQQKVIDKSKSLMLKNPNNVIGYSDLSKKTGSSTDFGLPELSKQPSYNKVYKKVTSVGTTISRNLHPNADVPRQYLNTTGNQVASGFQGQIMDSLYSQHLQSASESLVHAAGSLNSYSRTNFLGVPQMDLPEYQNAYLGSLLAQQKLQYGMPFLSKSGDSDHGFYSSHFYGVGMPYPGSHLSTAIHTPTLGSGSPVRQGERLRISSNIRTAAGGSIGSWTTENGAMKEGYMSSLLEEFKNNKTRSFELSDIVGHVVEFRYSLVNS
ncbi:hypothetical protein BHM03_00046377 [Ensete ventricosum]|nr:hypothetical protein BHM03_00046377 [Ensete ventricosum]